MKKKHLKAVADYIQDFLSLKDSSFLHLTWYLTALDIIESKLFVEPTQPSKRTIPKYRVDISFVNKGLDFINLPSILRSNEVIENCPFQLEKSEIPMVVYSLNQSIRSKIFNYKDFVSSLDLHSFVNDNSCIECCCSEFDPSFVDNHHGHILTGNLSIVTNSKLRKLLSKGPKYREPVYICWDKAKKEITEGLDNYIDKLATDKGVTKMYFMEWRHFILDLVDNKINTLKDKIKSHQVKPTLTDAAAKEELNRLQNKFVIVPIDKAANNIAFICKRFYASVIAKELKFQDTILNNTTGTYEYASNKNKEQLIHSHKEFLNKNNINLKSKMEKLPVMYWIPKIHKKPTAFRFIIASPECSLKPLSKDITAIFKLFYKKVERYHMKGTLWSGINKFWVIQNNKPVIDKIIKLNKRSAARSMCTFDFSTLYTKIPHTKLLFVLDKIIDFAFKGGTRDTITVNESGAYWVKDNSRMKGIPNLPSKMQ